MFSTFDISKFKSNLKMASNRIQIIKTQRTQLSKASLREISQLLAQGKEEKARIKVEGVINDDNKCEGLEILALLCDLLCQRADLLKAEKNCPYDMKEAVYTVVWAADRSGIGELAEVKRQIAKKYGSDFVAAAMQNREGIVNEKVTQKLSIQPPSAALVQRYLMEVAATYGVAWTPAEEIHDTIQPAKVPHGKDATMAPASGLSSAWTPPPTAPPPPPPPPAANLDLFNIPTGIPGAEASAPAGAPPRSQPLAADDPLPDFDELEQRFNALRQSLR